MLISRMLKGYMFREKLVTPGVKRSVLMFFPGQVHWWFFHEFAPEKRRNIYYGSTSVTNLMFTLQLVAAFLRWDNLVILCWDVLVTQTFQSSVS